MLDLSVIDKDTVLGMAKHYSIKERPPKGTFWVYTKDDKFVFETTDRNEADKRCPTEGYIVGNDFTYIFNVIQTKQ